MAFEKTFDERFEISGDYLIIKDKTWMRRKKITGHPFVEICGYSPFKKYPGDVILERLSLYKADDVDVKYLYRGDIAETIAKVYFDRQHKCVTYDKKEVNYDNFPENSTFGGLIDIDVPDENFLIEVKGKSLKDYDKILNNPPKEEVYQGIMYGVLKGYEKITMIWILFDPETEKEAFLNQKLTTLKNIKKIEKDYVLTPELIEEVKAEMQRAKDMLDEVESTRRIKLDLISQDILTRKLGYKG